MFFHAKLVRILLRTLVIDIDTRRLSKFPELVESDEKCIKENVIAEPAPKIVMPKDCTPECVATRDVAYSDLDMLGHVNNVKYTEWSMNAIELEVTTTRCLKELVINFNNEVKPGDKVELYRHKEEGENGSLVYYIEGRVNGKSSFIEKLVF